MTVGSQPDHPIGLGNLAGYILLKNFLRKSSSLMMVLLLIGCASPKSTIPTNAAAPAPELNSGQDKNRTEAGGSRNRLYSFLEDSDLPKGGFSILKPETIEAKIKSFQEKWGVASYFSKIAKGSTLELYAMWGGVFTHCAIRIETDPSSFYQIELQNLPDLKRAGMKDFNRTGAAIQVLGVTADQFDIVEFTDKNERKKLDGLEPNYAVMPICIDKKAAPNTTRGYRDCLSRYAESYNPETAIRTGKPAKAYNYDPIGHNCCNFAEEALEACGLAHCFDLGKSTGLHHKTGPLEEWLP